MNEKAWNVGLSIIVGAALFCAGGATGSHFAPASDSCKDALTKAETVIQDGQKALTVTAGGIGIDVYAMDAATAQLRALEPQVKNDRAAYDDAAAKCRG